MTSSPSRAGNSVAPQPKSAAPTVKLPAKPAKAKAKPASAPKEQVEALAMGSWGGGSPASAGDSSNGSAVDLGAWSKPADSD